MHRLTNGTRVYSYLAGVPDNAFALTGSWAVSDQAITSGADARLQLNYNASNVYLDVGGTGTVTASVNGHTKTVRVSGAPDIYPVVHTDSPQVRTLTLTLSPGLRAYSFTFG